MPKAFTGFEGSVGILSDFVMGGDHDLISLGVLPGGNCLYRWYWYSESLAYFCSEHGMFHVWFVRYQAILGNGGSLPAT